MILRHPLYMLLILLLVVGVAGSGMLGHNTHRIDKSVCVIEEECLEELMEGQHDLAILVSDLEWTALCADLQLVRPLHLNSVATDSATHHSFGWALPLRI